ncbi:unnamed protein product [Miscanthus lutarioriparius]|uniref:Uncharacterized protein n=1 Tax=Miscanthus lutarioriparius TaxID=422564 RepID=A0A811QSH0_9POAL|nr:unnamed protein product [Miscanthus lutarioriparius]
MEKEKWKSLDYILKLNCKVSLQGYLRAISKVAKQARSCYPEDIGVDRKLFLQMLLLDSCFILVKVDGTVLAARSIETQSAEATNQGAGNSIIEEIGVNSDQIAESQRSKHERASENSVHEIELSNCQMETGYDRRYCAQSVHHHQYDCNMVADWYANYAWHDLFLLENQIPFFIIETVYEQVKDCFRTGQLPSWWCTASQYHEAGIKLEKRVYDENNKHSLLDMKFSSRTIEIPFLAIDENTESLFKNVIAFEQTDPGLGNDFTAYISVMSQHINTSDDATPLVGKGIILHVLDNDAEVSQLFTRLSKQIVFYADKQYYLKSLGHELETHYQSRLNRWMAWLWLNHCSNPWLVLAVLAAAVMLLCTVVQTIYTVLAYVEPAE